MTLPGGNVTPSTVTGSANFRVMAGTGVYIRIDSLIKRVV